MTQDTTKNSSLLDDEANIDYYIDYLPEVESDDFVKVFTNLINLHQEHQVPRLELLSNYYKGKNRILTAELSGDKYRADNRVASGYADLIVTTRVGQLLGSPIGYRSEDEDLAETITELNDYNNIAEHDSKLFNDMAVYGRAYELVSVENDRGFPDLSLSDVMQTFVVYDTKVKPSSLFAVRYFAKVDPVDSNKIENMAIIYTTDEIITYVKNSGRYELVESEPHFFDAVPITQYRLNSYSRGSFEPVISQIDAYDKITSESVNTEEEQNNPMLMIKGSIDDGVVQKQSETDAEFADRKARAKATMRKSNILMLKTPANYDGQNADAKFLNKSFNTDNTKQNLEQLHNAILQFTYTPDTKDANFAASQSGEAIKWKMISSDNVKSTQEDYFKKGIMRRYRVAANVLKITRNKSMDYDKINDIDIVFTDNTPHSETEIVSKAKALDGIVSKRTQLEIIASLTNISADDELARMAAEAKTAAATEATTEPSADTTLTE